MRPLFNKGVRPEAFSDMLLELHSKRYFKDYLEREYLMKRSDSTLTPRLKTLFSTFGDKSKYAGCVPTGKYIADVYKLHAPTVADQFSKEVTPTHLYLINVPLLHCSATRMIFFWL
jgi:hypothetical protein